ncbi:hypothetical protein YSA_00065 [Pseudomonas putida ND6]|uniref:Uncharacterized protein n=1 Tax=Pseudomonas putida ND6 TaxID=231023 RepID=I3UMU8_PSEPU|nr:hypothetical protein YSA_00065 [Pseudomonas putida ND6]
MAQPVITMFMRLHFDNLKRLTRTAGQAHNNKVQEHDVFH